MLLVESKQIGEKQIERNKWSLKNYKQPLLHKHFYILSGPLMFWGFFTMILDSPIGSSLAVQSSGNRT